ncbi:MAG: bifunctional 3-deoxy-7-phosphoheptulonate synthase/chorismate mutase type II [Sphingobacteriales bacterium]|nr:MAG: bifunctional 3-deoxy-7-phosphoheptulonate synthase/chorismate mutase type II [Sphingobacteriales bacterium]
MTTIKNVGLEQWNIGVELGKPLFISGPCSAETEEQVLETCIRLAKKPLVHILRAGIWKPRTRPNSFEGVGSIGLQWLKEAGKETGLPVCTEVANAKHVYEALRMGIDILWIGARTTVNPFAVQEIADALVGVDIPVMVKNPVNPDLELWIGALERLNYAGIFKLAAIHRGFSTYGKHKYRNRPQWEIPIELMRRFPDLPIICDPSHICGTREYLSDIAQKAMDLNFTGLMIESHINPSKALSDAEQQLVPEMYHQLIEGLVMRSSTSADQTFLHNLEELREIINEFDDKIIELIGQRMNVSKQIGRFKKATGITILQSARWDEIIHTRCEHGLKVGLSLEFTEALYNAIHKESIQHQASVMYDK